MPEKITKNNPRKHAKKHGFLARIASFSGRKTIKRRRAKGRHKI